MLPASTHGTLVSDAQNLARASNAQNTAGTADTENAAGAAAAEDIEQAPHTENAPRSLQFSGENFDSLSRLPLPRFTRPRGPLCIRLILLVVSDIRWRSRLHIQFCLEPGSTSAFEPKLPNRRQSQRCIHSDALVLADSVRLLQAEPWNDPLAAGNRRSFRSRYRPADRDRPDG